MLKKCMTPTCGVCKKLGKMLDDMKIEYEDIDVSDNPEFLEKYSITSVPTLLKDNGDKLVGVHTSNEIRNFLNS